MFPCFDGVFCCDGKKGVFGYVNSQAFHFQKSIEFKHKAILHNVIFLRGIEFLIFGTYIFLKALLLSNSMENGGFKVSNYLARKTKISFEGIFCILVGLISLLLSFLLFGFLPSYLAIIFVKINKHFLLRNFVFAIFKAGLLTFGFFVLKFLSGFEHIYDFNYACNIVVCPSKKGYLAKNYLNFLIFGFIFSLFMITFLSIATSPIFKFLINLTVLIACFSIAYEILCQVDKIQNPKFAKWFSFLSVGKKNQTALLVARSAYWECKMIENTDDKNQKMSVVLAYVQNKLIENNINDFMEAQWLVCGVLGKKPTELLFVGSVSKSQEQAIKSVLERRIKGEPLDKIFGKKDFYGMEFKVDQNVLSPRSETELLAEQVILASKDKNFDILDLCTGSGALAVAIKKNTNCKMYASDVSKNALEIAKYNAKANDCKIKFCQSNMFADLNKKQKYDIIVSNPPYIKSGDIENLDMEVKFYDPLMALDGGEDGLAFYKIIASESPKFLKKNGMLFLEIGIGQAGDVKKLLKKNFVGIKVLKDYNQIERIIIARKKENVRKN